MAMTEYTKSKKAADSRIYTLEQWRQDIHFKAKEGQEVTEGVYNQMKNCVKPFRLPKEKVKYAIQKFRLPIQGGFLMGEPVTSADGINLYMAFGVVYSDIAKQPKHYYFLGVAPKEDVLHGVYYRFEYFETSSDELFLETAFENDNEAILYAKTKNATMLDKLYYDDDRLVSFKELYINPSWKEIK